MISYLINEGILGKVKVWQSRLATYVSMISFVMIFYVFIVNNDWLPWFVWLVLIVAVLLSIVWFDVHFVLPHSFRYMWEKNPAFQRLEDKVDDLLVVVKQWRKK